MSWFLIKCSTFCGYSTSSFFVVFLGSIESAEASHLERDHCQCHLWGVLDYCLICLRIELLWYLYVWCCLVRHCRHDVHAQFCCQPFCLFSVEWAIQGKVETNDKLQVFNCRWASWFQWTLQSRATRQHSTYCPQCGCGLHLHIVHGSIRFINDLRRQGINWWLLRIIVLEST